MVYTVKLQDKVLYYGTSAEDAARIDASHEGAESFTEGIQIWWVRKEVPVRKPIKAVTAVTLLNEYQKEREGK